MGSVNVEKRLDVFYRFCEPMGDAKHCFGRRELVDNILRLVEERQVVGLDGLFRSGKTTILRKVAQELGENRSREIWIGRAGELTVSCKWDFEGEAEKAKKQGVALIDEGGIVRMDEPKVVEVRDNFLDWIRKLRADSIPVVISYPRILGTDHLEKAVDEVHRVVVPITISEDAIREMMHVLFIGTGIKFSDSAVNELIRASNRIAGAVRDICWWLFMKDRETVRTILELKKRLLFSGEDVESVVKMHQREFQIFHGFDRGLTKGERMLLARIVKGEELKDEDKKDVEELRRYEIIGPDFELPLLVKEFARAYRIPDS